MNLHEISSLRKFALPFLAKLGPGDITIRHHYVAHRFHLHAYKHKGYWYHGKNREKATMALFQRLIKPGNTVIEVGAHIGYISLYFSNLVGDNGRVYLFEPGNNNLPYLEKNIRDINNITLVKKAVSNFVGKAAFFVENLTGQNNSLNQNYSVFQTNSLRAFSAEQYVETEVAVVTLDQFLQEAQVHPNFIKIDIEGAELLALQGMQTTLERCRPMLMIEITQNHQDVYNLLVECGYTLFTEAQKPIEGYEQIVDNTFCLHKEAHAQQVAEMQP